MGDICRKPPPIEFKGKSCDGRRKAGQVETGSENKEKLKTATEYTNTRRDWNTSIWEKELILNADAEDVYTKFWPTVHARMEMAEEDNSNG